jgi:hypothetical protein
VGQARHLPPVYWLLNSCGAFAPNMDVGIQYKAKAYKKEQAFAFYWFKTILQL